jgi:DNA modification methylase
MAKQHALFELDDADGRVIRHRNRKAVTFKGGQKRFAHRWFRLTPSFSPELVTALLSEFGGSESKVLDPFSGRGTTAIECQIKNVSCTGIEINPMLHFAGVASLNWRIDPVEAKKEHEWILRYAEELRGKHSETPITELAEQLEIGFPQIRNVFRWWREDVLRDLLILKASIFHKANSESIRDLYLLTLANILLDAANITLGRLQLHFVDRSADEIDSFELYSIAAETVLSDLAELSTLPTTNWANIHHGDTCFLSSLVEGDKFDLVITSPPYPNRYSYVWNTRPHLYFLDMFENSKQAGQLDCTTIGGTWGVATSRHAKGEFEYTDTMVPTVVGTIVQEIREKDLLMSNYVAMYFDDLYRHIKELKKTLKKNAICAYVVGNSRIKKCLVDTDLLLSQLFQAAGFREIRLEQIRKRNSGKELHETIVIVESAGSD